MDKPLTHAELTLRIARIARTATSALAYLSEGMWNPKFCSAECSAYALSICEQLEHQTKQIEARAMCSAGESE